MVGNYSSSHMNIASSFLFLGGNMIGLYQVALFLLVAITFILILQPFLPNEIPLQIVMRFLPIHFSNGSTKLWFHALEEIFDVSVAGFVLFVAKLDYCFGFFKHAPVTLFEISVLQMMQSSKVRFVGHSFGLQQIKKAPAQKTGNE